MQIAFYKSESTVRPDSVTHGKQHIYIHKNIQEKTVTDMDYNEVTMYEYDEAVLTPAEYEQYQNEQRLNDLEDAFADMIGG